MSLAEPVALSSAVALVTCALVACAPLGCSSSGGASPLDASGSTDAGHADARGPSDAGPTDGPADAGVRASDGALPADASGPSDGASDGGAKPMLLLYVAAGYDVRRVVSTDGTTWMHDTYAAPDGRDNILSTIAVGNGIVVGVADTGIYTSTDGVHWAVSPTPTGENLHGAALGYGGGRFVFVAQDLSYVSEDGLTWQKNLTTNASAAHWQGIAYGTIGGVGHYMAIGDGCHKTSEDGLTWHDYVTGIESLASITFYNGAFVATGAHGTGSATVARSVVSTDAKAFGADSLVSTTCYSTGFGGVVTDGTKLITTDGCNAWTSTDGQTWTKRGSGANRGALAFAGGRCVAVNYYASLYESDDCTDFHLTDDLSKTPSMFVDGGVAPILGAITGGLVSP